MKYRDKSDQVIVISGFSLTAVKHQQVTFLVITLDLFNLFLISFFIYSLLDICKTYIKKIKEEYVGKLVKYRDKSDHVIVITLDLFNIF